MFCDMFIDWPATADNHCPCPGQRLYRPGMPDEDFIEPPHAEIRVYWVTSDGHHVTDSVESFYVTREAADEATKNAAL